jgi:acetyltransferase-like isoleucine patch superfamily enzyme
MDIDKIKKGLNNPAKSYNYLKLLFKGFYYKLKYMILNKNVQIGKNFKVRYKLSIKGPGKVTIGNNVFIDGTSHTVTPWTSNKNAEIVIGNNVFLNGTRFGCSKKIEIGDNCIIADCRILDTDFHSILPEKRYDPDAIQSAPIKIGKNVWLALDCVILRGVSIGDNSTISARSVVYSDVPEYSVYGGNPAVFIKEVPRNSR